MPTLNITLLIAIIGCITGISSLLINIIKFLNERVKLKVFLNKGIYFNQNYSNESLLYDFLGTFTFINKSSMPITVYSIDFINTETSKIYHNQKCHQNSINLITCKYSDKSWSTCRILMSNQIKFPLRIDPYDAITTKIYLPRVKIKHSNNSFSFKAIIKTPRKSIKISCTFDKHVAQYKNKYDDEDCDPCID